MASPGKKSTRREREERERAEAEAIRAAKLARDRRILAILAASSAILFGLGVVLDQVALAGEHLDIILFGASLAACGISISAAGVGALRAIPVRDRRGALIAAGLAALAIAELWLVVVIFG